MIWLGTSGFSFRDWVGPFYPPGTPAGRMLEYYTQVFPAVEINSTYYRLPDPATFRRMCDRTPPGFRFTVKLPGTITHRGEEDPSAFRAFARVVEPLARAGKLHGALAQFPFGFRNTEENRNRIAAIRKALPEWPLFVEFRHDSWNRPETWDLLEEHAVGFVSVDEPALPGLFPPTTRVIGPAAYVRLHGRNAADWWGSDGSKRYDYLYDEAELREWALRIHRLSGAARDTFVFFNNCHGGSAAQNAGQMGFLLGQLQDLDEGM